MATSPSLDVLKTSAHLQSDLIRQLSSTSKLDDMLTRIVERAAQDLQAGACAIFTVDQPERRSATQRAGTGYQAQYAGSQGVGMVPDSEVTELPDPSKKLGLTGWILSTGKPFLASKPEEVRHHPHHLGRLESVEGEIHLASFLGVPIRGMHGEVIGMIKAERRLNGPASSSQPFEVLHELGLESIARVTSRCMAYHDVARKGPQAEAEAVTSWARDVIAEAVATEGEVDSFLDIVVRVTAAAMRADACGIFLKDESGKTLTQRAGLGHLALRHVIRAYELPDPSRLQQCRDVQNCRPPECTHRLDRVHRAGDEEEGAVGLTAWIQITGKSFHASCYEDLCKHCHHKGAYDRQNFSTDRAERCGAFLGVPLQVGNTIIGVLKVENISTRESQNERDFPIDAQRRFEILAQDIALAIVRLDKQLESRYGIIHRAEKTILEILRGGRDLKGLVQQVVEETRTLFQAGACALFLKEGNLLRQPRWAAAGWFQRGQEVREYELVPLDAIKEDPSPSERVGLTVWIAVTQKKFTARSNTELRMHPHHKGTFDQDNFEPGKLERCESFMGFPLLVEDRGEKKLVGVLKVESKMRYVDGVKEYTYFNELDEVVFELIANSAALAIQNTFLADDTAREKAWQEFSAMAAHRIGTEAVRIRNALRWLRDDLQTSPVTDVEQNLGRAVEALKRIDAYVYEFTQFASPPQAKTESVDINQLCRDVHHARGGGGDLQPTLDLDPDLPMFWGDRERLRYALEEMFQNAFKAVRDRGSDGRIMIRTRFTEDSRIRLEYIDNGPGVPPEQKTEIFQAGVRFRAGGTGLGLAIVRKTIEQHGGTIREVGTQGEAGGAWFVIELPSGFPIPRTQSILIVEDNEDLRPDLARFLGKNASHRNVQTASNEIDALELVRQTRFDLVITDVDLSEAGGTSTGGLELLKKLRGNHPRLPVIVMSAFPRYESEAKSLGCIHFVPRPYPDPERDFMDVMRESVDDVLGRDHDRSAAASRANAEGSS